MKQLFINPFGSNWIQGSPDKSSIAIRMAPIGILSIAACLLKAGHQVKVYDCASAAESESCRILDCVNSFKPEIINFSAVASSFMHAYFLAQEIKNRRRMATTPAFYIDWRNPGLRLHPAAASSPLTNCINCAGGAECPGRPPGSPPPERG